MQWVYKLFDDRRITPGDWWNGVTDLSQTRADWIKRLETTEKALNQYSISPKQMHEFGIYLRERLQQIYVNRR